MRGSVVSLGCQHKIYLFNKAFLMRYRKSLARSLRNRALNSIKTGMISFIKR
ncbi:hypothetical protein [Candidatus Symbiopectobacterium sp.]|uniref:hypothetical protein n=1 Tax=Candidatus Symbiopectobacterium sp. TaxID=2816440 RepID=UPI0025C6DF8E|nr:hypothetical protein [Candidatus Symbiopectobacterium sp.]